MNYTDINAKIVDGWVQNGWEWGKPISHEVFEKARKGEWGVYLTPTKIVPHEWFGEMRGKKILGLASGGGQQIPIFTALGADCTVRRKDVRLAKVLPVSGGLILWVLCNLRSWRVFPRFFLFFQHLSKTLA